MPAVARVARTADQMTAAERLETVDVLEHERAALFDLIRNWNRIGVGAVIH